MLHSVYPHFDAKFPQLFSEIVCLFRSAIINKPEGLLESELTKRGRIEHHFYAMDSVSIVFVEVGKTFVLGRGRLDVIMQVLAECAGMSSFLSITDQMQTVAMLTVIKHAITQTQSLNTGYLFLRFYAMARGLNS